MFKMTVFRVLNLVYNFVVLILNAYIYILSIEGEYYSQGICQPLTNST